MQQQKLPPPIRTDGSNAFAFHTMSQRVPENFDAVVERNPDYPETIKTDVHALAEALRNDADIELFPPPAPDYESWLESSRGELPAAWHNTGWFFAETLAYRKLIAAVRFFETGRDPFAPVKDDELAGDSPWKTVEAAVSVEGTMEERIASAIRYSLWANRIDLSYGDSHRLGSDPGSDDTVIADESDRCAPSLAAPGGTVHIVTDNTGSELAADMVLARTLITVPDRTVVVHVKFHPTYVSDATAADVVELIRRMEPARTGDQGAPERRRCAQDLRTAFEQGRLRVAPHPYWNSSRFLRDLPAGLSETFSGSRMTILKGDMNYRRLSCDAQWPVGTGFDAIASCMPCPVLSVRTLKSDTLAGGEPDRIRELDRREPGWRSGGKYAAVQFWRPD
jgi:hypothetical protein